MFTSTWMCVRVCVSVNGLQNRKWAQVLNPGTWSLQGNRRLWAFSWQTPNTDQGKLCQQPPGKVYLRAHHGGSRSLREASRGRPPIAVAQLGASGLCSLWSPISASATGSGLDLCWSTGTCKLARW